MLHFIVNPASSTGGAPSTGSSPGGQFLSGGAPRSPSTKPVIRAPIGARFTMTTLQEYLSDFDGALIDDRRGLNGGRLWVEDPKQRRILSKKLAAWGFRWSEKREAWYYPET